MYGLGIQKVDITKLQFSLLANDTDVKNVHFVRKKCINFFTITTLKSLQYNVAKCSYPHQYTISIVSYI